MPDILHFTLMLDFWIPINILELCSATQLSYLEIFWSFQIIIEARPFLGSYSVFSVLRFYNPAVGDTLSWPRVGSGYCLLWSLVWLFPWPELVSSVSSQPHTDQYSKEFSLQISGVLFLCCSFLSDTLLFLDSQLCHLNSRGPPTLLGSPFYTQKLSRQ